VTADATGGNGGDALDALSNAGRGGTASVSASGVSTTTGAEAVTVAANATGGAGGTSTGDIAFLSGVGGLATATSVSATSEGAGPVSAAVSATGGNGGAGIDNAIAGIGGAAVLTNVASGHSNGGILTLNQSATGGIGGSTNRTSNGGNGGAATSTLTFNDALNAMKSNSIISAVSATGGQAGSAQRLRADVLAGTGGGATASDAVTGTKAVSVTATATGGTAGTALVGGLGGSAAANAIAIAGTQGDATAVAHGGLGTGSSALAKATGSGQSGTVHALSDASVPAGTLVTRVASDASTTLAGTASIIDSATDTVRATIGQAASASDTLSQGVALISGAPTAANVTSILTANSNIAAAFNTKTPSYFAVAEVGGRYTTAGSGVETTHSSLDLSVDLTRLAVKHDLLVGLYGGQGFGTGVTNITLDISANGTSLLHQSFASAGAAVTYFTNHAVDLGSLTAPLYASGTANIHVALDVTSNSAGSGFYANLLIGDPPATTTAARLQNLTAAIASFAPNHSHMANDNLFHRAQNNNQPFLAAARA
jgi:hypothetical protein